jgi:hypothetical protein
VTFVQRCDASLRLNPHFHTQVARWTHARLVKVVARHGRSLDGADDGGADALVSEQPVLASCYAASAADVQLLGAEPGASTRKLGRPVAVRATHAQSGAAVVEGVNVHAGVAVDGRDRPKLERLCRYVARPPLSTGSEPADPRRNDRGSRLLSRADGGVIAGRAATPSTITEPR